MKLDMSNKSNDMQDNTPNGSAGKSSESNYLKLQQSAIIRNNILGISKLLNTGLNGETLDICIKLIEAGVHPQALAEVIKKIREEVALLNEQQQQQQNEF